MFWLSSFGSSHLPLPKRFCFGFLPLKIGCVYHPSSPPPPLSTSFTPRAFNTVSHFYRYSRFAAAIVLANNFPYFKSARGRAGGPEPPHRGTVLSFFPRVSARSFSFSQSFARKMRCFIEQQTNRAITARARFIFLLRPTRDRKHL